MKYFIFLIGLFLFVPAGIIMSTISSRIRDLVFILMIFSTAFTDLLDIKFMAREWYRAPTYGFEFSFVDFFALIIFFSTLLSKSNNRFKIYWPAGLSLMCIFFLYSSINVFYSNPKLFGMFELSKQIRGILFFLAVAFYINSTREIKIFIYSIAGVLLYQGLLCLYQRYSGAQLRVTGSFVHSNILGQYCILFAPISLTIVFSSTKNTIKLVSGLAWIFAGIAVVLSISRMSALVYILSTGGILINASIFKFSFKNALIVVLCIPIAGGLLYRGFDKIQARHSAHTSGHEENLMLDRQGYWDTAILVFKENPLGIGLNNWSYIVSERYAEDYAPGQGIQPYISPNEPGDGGGAVVCHTALGLTLAELGLPGIIIFISMWIYWVFLTGRYLIRFKFDLLSCIMVGCYFSILSVFLMLTIEHVFRWQYFYLAFNVFLGVIAAITNIKYNSTKNI